MNRRDLFTAALGGAMSAAGVGALVVIKAEQKPAPVHRGEDWAPSSAYQLGDTVDISGKRYRCVVAGTSDKGPLVMFGAFAGKAMLVPCE